MLNGTRMLPNINSKDIYVPAPYIVIPCITTSYAIAPFILAFVLAISMAALYQYVLIKVRLLCFQFNVKRSN